MIGDKSFWTLYVVRKNSKTTTFATIVHMTNYEWCRKSGGSMWKWQTANNLPNCSKSCDILFDTRIIGIGILT